MNVSACEIYMLIQNIKINNKKNGILVIPIATVEFYNKAPSLF